MGMFLTCMKEDIESTSKVYVNICLRTYTIITGVVIIHKLFTFRK